MPKTNSKKKKKENIIKCFSCNESKPKSSFYISYNKMDETNGVLPYCKDCIRTMCNGEGNTADLNKTLPVLKKIDKPYIDRLWKMATIDNSINAIGKYIRMLNMNQYRLLTWNDGDLNKSDNIITVKNEDIIPTETVTEKGDYFKVTNEIIELFGTGYTKEEYFKMNEKYNFLKEGYDVKNPILLEALLSYIRPKVKEEIATANGNTQEAKTWADMSQKAADRAKINPNQLSKADLQGGLNTVGEIALAAEQQKDIIKILPEFKFRPNDAVDFCIWEYLNYARVLQGLPEIEYKDVYKFYDKKKKDYIEQYGDSCHIFDEDPTEDNRESVEKFIKIKEDEEEK